MYPESYKIESSKRTPRIILEPGKIFILGRSIPENPGEFYRPVHDWMSKYTQNYIHNTKIILGFEYLNTSSTKWIYTILKELSGKRELIMNTRVTWYYEAGDEDMCELGYIIRSLVECPLKLMEVDDLNEARYDMIISSAT